MAHAARRFVRTAGAFASEAECLRTCAHAKWACVQSKDNRPNFAGADGKMCVIDTQGGVCPYLSTCESACSVLVARLHHPHPHPHAPTPAPQVPPT